MWMFFVQSWKLSKTLFKNFNKILNMFEGRIWIISEYFVNQVVGPDLDTGT
jgi:hypothetical protein